MIDIFATLTKSFQAWYASLITIIWIGWLQIIINALDGSGLSLGNSRISILSVMKFSFFAGLFIVLANVF